MCICSVIFRADISVLRTDLSGYIPTIQGEYMDSSNIVIPPVKRGSSYTVITSFSLQDPGEETDSKAVFGTAGLCYVSGKMKGPGTIAAAPDGRCMRNPTGNCGMAKGGSGDVLAGMLVSLLGLGLPPMDACCAAVWLHGRAGDLAARQVGLWGMTPSDLLDRIPAALREVTE